MKYRRGVINEQRAKVSRMCDIPNSSYSAKGITENYKKNLDEVFVISRIIKVDRGKGYQPKQRAEADNPDRDLDYSGYHKNRI